MASTASTIPITHVAGSSLRKDVGPDKTEFPSLPGGRPSSSSSNANKDDDGGEWEFIDDETTTPAPVSPLGVSFCPKTTKSVEKDAEDDEKPSTAKMNPKILKHAVSSPDLREYVLESESEDSSSSEAEEGDGDEEGSSSVGVLVGDVDATSDAGSSAVLVSGPPSVWSAAGGISFKDAILKNHKPATPATASTDPSSKSNHHHHLHHSSHHHHSHHKHKKVIKKVKPTFVVTPIKRASKSTGDLLGLLKNDAVELDDDDDEAILGDSDAMEYYGRKSAGAMNRKNGRKSRPDESKRLQMTMAKKADQKRRQQQGGH